jgi:CO/xanthine dehydrogenase FAD-binding subunit
MSGSSRFAAPTDLEAALEAIADGHRPIAGGTDLVVGWRQGKWDLPADLVSIDRIDALREAREEGGGLRIGATVRHADLAADQRILARWTALADAASIVGSPATRGTGTLGGNLANASPAAETTGPLICFGAEVEVASRSGSRRIPIEDLHVGPGRTSMAPDELIVAVALPALADGTGSCYVRLEFRRQMEIAVVGATAVATLEGDRVRDARLAITAVAPTVRRVPDAETALVGTDGGRSAAEGAARAAAAASSPISDVRASDAYRRAMVEVIVRRAVTGAVARARGESVTVPASASLFGAA